MALYKPRRKLQNGQLEDVRIPYSSVEGLNPFFYKTKIKPYLYTVIYENLDYEFAKQYIDEKYNHYNAGCSTISKGKFVGRNFDWYYDTEASFVVRTSRSQGRYASLGIASGIKELSESFANSNETSELYKVLPFLMEDGVNEKSVYCNINVVPAGDKGLTSGTIPLVTQREKISGVMLVRYILDNFASAKEAVKYIRDYVSIYGLKPENGEAQEFHFLVRDLEDTYILEFINNQLVILSSTDSDFVPIPNNKAIMTNFYLYGWSGQIKSKVMGDSDSDIEETGLTDHAMGLERYNIASAKYDSLMSKNAFVELMVNDLKYTKTYTTGISPFWFSEYNARYNTFGNITIYSTASEYSPVVTYSKNKFNNRSRDESSEYFGTWQTAHSSIYNIEDKKLYLYVQEEIKETSHELVIDLYDLNIPVIDDKNLVHKTGQETINGTKIFINKPKYSNSALPDEYQQVEYIQSSGTQYIDTGIISTNNTGINIDYAYTEVSENVRAGICGIYQGTSPRTDTLFISTVSGKTNSTIAAFHRGGTIETTVEVIALAKYNFKINWLNDSRINFNNEQYSYTGNNNVIPVSIVLFGRLNQSNNTYAYTNARIYEVQFSENNNIISRLIPCYRIADETIGMYDTVRNTFYTNAGTGTFTKGPNIDVLTTATDLALVTDIPNIPGTNITINNNVIGTTGTNNDSTAVALGVDSIANQGCISIGYGAQSRDNAIGSIVMGSRIVADHNFSVSIGFGAQARNNYAVALGDSANSSGEKSTALGYHAYSRANNSMQLGEGENNTANSLQFRSTQIVNGDGKIPSSNLDVSIPTKTSDITNDSGFITSSDISGKMDKSGGTFTGEIGKSFGEIKSFHCSHKGYTNGATWYFPVCKLPIDNAGNYASALFNGRIGGWTASSMAQFSALGWQRGNYTGEDGRIIGWINPANTTSSAFNIADLVLYKQSDLSAIVYVKCYNYYTFDFNVDLFQNTCVKSWNETYTTTPSGTLISAATFSANAKNIKDMVLKSELPTKTSDLTNDSGFITSADIPPVPTYTAGKLISISNRTISVEGTYTGSTTNSLAIQGLVGSTNATSVGYSSQASVTGSSAFGYNSKATSNNSTAIGSTSTASNATAVAIGYGATASAAASCQIGQGTNSTASSLQYRSTMIVDSNGKIPFANLDTGFASDTDYTNYIGEI